MTLSFEDLFALRFAYQDLHNDESIIIKELKKELIRSGMDKNNIDDYLVNFYKNYGIEIPKEIIASVQLPIPRRPRIRLTDLSGNNILNFLLNPNNFNSSVNLVNQTLNSQLNQENNDSDDSDDSDNSSDNDDLPELESDNDVPELESDTDNEMPELESDTVNTQNVQSSNQYVPFTSPANILMQGFNQTPNATLFLQNFLNIMNLQNPQNMEDVRATLDEDGEKEIKNYKLEKKIEGTCAVCMMEFEKDQEVSELKCNHIFHKDCVMKWLKEYNYKCPVCRAECGKPKFNL